MVTMLTASGRMVQLSNSRRGPFGYDQRLEAHRADEVLFIDNRPQTDVRIAGPSGALSEHRPAGADLPRLEAL
jgi:myo-inositol 2-dehydrogenase/D-chiro-inositol 1-dehydrogenase